MTTFGKMKDYFPPEKFGLYDRKNDSDSCGVGFIAKTNGEKSHDIVEKGLQILANLEHRGATGSDPKAGDGAGISLQISHDFYSGLEGMTLPHEGEYGVGMFFLPPSEKDIQTCKAIIEKTLIGEKLQMISWRDVPTDNSCLSKNMLSREPVIKQVFIGTKRIIEQDVFERKLYVARRLIEKNIAASNVTRKDFFYCASMSSYTVIYKGMFLSEQLRLYYTDLTNKLFKSSIAVVHQRYSTNTFPSWGLAQPFRFISHNGEINTIQGNINWANSRECELYSSLFGEDLKKLFPVIQHFGSDTACFDNMFELLYMTGRSMEHAMSIMVPEAWENDKQMDPVLRAFYEYNSSMVEPWDGPAALVFTNGRQVGGALDRNGLRPLRYTETRDGFFVMASESGVLDFQNDNIIRKGKIKPGQMVMVDTEESIVMFNNEIKDNLSRSKDYRQWVQHNIIQLDSLPSPPVKMRPLHTEIRLSQSVFGYTYEELNMLIKNMATKKEETIFAMGTDTPLAIFSDRAKNLYDYFKQRFAQVTNPPIDSIREEIVMSLNSNIGGGGNILLDNPYNCHMLVIKQPILTNQEIEQLKTNQSRDFRVQSIDICYDIQTHNLKEGLENIFKLLDSAIDEGYKLIILSDRLFSEHRVPIPSLLALSASHHYLIRTSRRGKVGIIVETGDARETHHFAMLIGYGAGAINPYLVLDSIDELCRYGDIVEKDKTSEVLHDDLFAQRNYIAAVNKGLKKVFAKMGISTLISYQAAQIFEAIGIDKSVIDEYFTGTRTAFEGVGLEGIEAEIKKRHENAYNPEFSYVSKLKTGGEYSWRVQGEKHLYSPEAIHYLQQAAWKNDRGLYNQFVKIADSQDGQLFHVRNALTFKYDKQKSIPIDEVEPATEIVKRFSTGAMSIGAISREAHEDLAIAMNDFGGKSNTGEGGEDEARYIPDKNGNLRISRIKQVASGRFGVTGNYLLNAEEIQIKMAQGAKPGEGGQLPGFKVDEYIAKLRHTVPGVSLISPPPHHDIYSIEDLAQLIFDLKNANRNADISVKLVSSFAVGTVAAGVVKAKADSITIAGYDGGTGASPASSIKHAGMPWEIGLAETQQTLVLNNLRGNVRIQVDGQIRTGKDVMVGAMLGADEFGFATSALITLGCIMMRKCHLNTCPVGVATQNPYLRSKYHGKPEYVKNYFLMIAQEVREYMAKLGIRKFDDAIGRVELLDKEKLKEYWKFKQLNLSPILEKPKSKENVYRNVAKQKHQLDGILDRQLIELCQESIKNKEPIELDQPIKNSDRTTGTMLGSEITKVYGSQGLPDDTIRINFLGTAGQSFGAFLPRGITLKLSGDANDYAGKGLSGGKIIVTPTGLQNLVPERNVIIGNTTLYGATDGKAFFCGLAGERFAVRNSGATAVVEGTGDHCCEYMTGGVVVILGEVGRNFGAGMSGGIAYVYDKNKTFRSKCNLAMVDIEQIQNPDMLNELKLLIEEHTTLTGSHRGRTILSGWRNMMHQFMVVVPLEYRTAMEKKYEALKTG